MKPEIYGGVIAQRMTEKNGPEPLNSKHQLKQMAGRFLAAFMQRGASIRNAGGFCDKLA